MDRLRHLGMRSRSRNQAEAGRDEIAQASVETLRRSLERIRFAMQRSPHLTRLESRAILDMFSKPLRGSPQLSEWPAQHFENGLRRHLTAQGLRCNNRGGELRIPLIRIRVP